MNMTLLFMYVLLFLTVLYILKVNAVCEEFGTCSASQNMNVPTCYCDDECFLYNDCCKEVMLRNNETDSQVTFTEETCVPLTSATERKVGSFMIDKCIGSKMLCEVKKGDLKTWIPVSNGNKTYRNADCAICNGVKAYNVWSVLFNMPYKYAKFITEEGQVKEEDILYYINNGTFETDADYHLQPPSGVSLRFCPYDIIFDEETHPDHNFNYMYQNAVRCSGKIYKNLDICSNRGCCNTSHVTCTNYYLYLLKVLESAGERSFVTGVHISLSFQQKDNKELMSTEDETKASMTFIGNRFFVLIALTTQNKVSNSFIECFHAAAIYLRSTAYVLVPSFNVFVRRSDNNNFFAYYISWSAKKLTTTDLNNLLKLGLSIRCEVESTNQTITGNIRVHGDHYNIRDDPSLKSFESAKSFTESLYLSRYRSSRGEVYNECRNLSISLLHRNEKETLLRILCLDKVAFLTSETNTGSSLDKMCCTGLFIWTVSLMLSKKMTVTNN